MRSNRDVVVGVLLVGFLGACSRRGAESAAPNPYPPPVALATAAPPESPPSSNPESPARVAWVVKSLESGRVTLTARVERFAPMAVPLAVTVAVPASVRVLQGKTSYLVPASDGAATNEAEFVFAFDAAPSDDIVLTADVQTPSFGVHATDAYRFGRPAPVGPMPKATGPHLKIGERDFGPTVPLQ